MLFYSEITLLLTLFILFRAKSFAKQEKTIDCRGVVHVTPPLNNWDYNYNHSVNVYVTRITIENCPTLHWYFHLMLHIISSTLVPV